MSDLERKKKQLELSRVRLGREELEFKIEERKEEMKKLQDAIQIQQEKEKELEELLRSI